MDLFRILDETTELALREQERNEPGQEPGVCRVSKSGMAIGTPVTAQTQQCSTDEEFTRQLRRDSLRGGEQDGFRGASLKMWSRTSAHCLTANVPQAFRRRTVCVSVNHSPHRP
jgi:hypothetical protein